MGTLREVLEALIRLSERKRGPDAPETRDYRRQLDAVTSSPTSAKAMFLLGGRTHSGNIPFRHRKRRAGRKKGKSDKPEQAN